MILLQYRHPEFLFFLLLAAPLPTVLTDITWDSPAAGDVYVPGDTLQAVWISQQKVVSPSFTICTGTDDNSTNSSDDPDCGTAVWPSVKQNGTEYSISLAIPNITGNGDYYLVMKDDTGTVYDTPNFSLALANNAISDANATSSVSQSASTSITYIPSHSGPAVAAIAIPLSLVAAILLGALLLLLCRAHQSRRREKDKERQIQEARETEMRSRQSSISFASATDIERAVLALSAKRGYGGGSPFTLAREPSHGGLDGAFAGHGLGAAAAAYLGKGAFGWAHWGGPTAPTVSSTTDAYTPAPMQRHATSSNASSSSYPYSMYATQSSQSDRETARRPMNWQETDWRSTDRMFAEEPASLQFSEPPQLPAIQVHASSPAVHSDIPPPLPPKQLFPGRLDFHAPRAYTPPYGTSALGSELRLPPTPGTETHPSLNLISNYMQASPAPPQAHYLTSQNGQGSELLVPRVPPPSMIRARSLRRVETLQDNEKPLPVRPEDRVGTELYSAVSRAVRG